MTLPGYELAALRARVQRSGVMRRWNGWGEESTNYPLSEPMRARLHSLLGAGIVATDATQGSVLAAASRPKTVKHGLLSSSSIERVSHAHGQSLADWVALRSGRLGVLPDAVAHPSTEHEVVALLEWAERERVIVIAYGGGTSVAGHINPKASDSPILTLALDRLTKLEHLDEVSHLARFEPGVRGPELERQLAEHGYLLGHYPQSFEYSTLGGWIATRSSGQQSYGYGRIEDLFAGGRVATFSGPLELPALPASAAGPDLRQFVLGSEGRLGVITSATLRVRRLPERESFHAVLFETWTLGFEAVKSMAQQRLTVSMLRLSDADETASFLHAPRGLERGLRAIGYGEERCLLLFAVTGTAASTLLVAAHAYAICRTHGGLPTGTLIGKLWKKNRFMNPYLRNTLWDAGYAVDTLETAVRWSRIGALTKHLKQSLRDGLIERDERVVCFAHLSHVYPDGASVYVTYLFRRTRDHDELLERWRTLKHAASEAIVQHGGTITHQHGVGTDHAPYLASEKSVVGMCLLKATLKALDPFELLNPGKLVT